MGVVYEEDVLIGSRDPEWLQEPLNVLIGLFHHIFLISNVAKFKTMTCCMGKIYSGMSEEVVGQISTGKGATYRKILQCWLP